MSKSNLSVRKQGKEQQGGVAEAEGLGVIWASVIFQSVNKQGTGGGLECANTICLSVNISTWGNGTEFWTDRQNY